MKTTLVYPALPGYGFGSLGKGMEAGWVSHGLAHISSAAQGPGLCHRLDRPAGACPVGSSSRKSCCAVSRTSLG